MGAIAVPSDQQASAIASAASKYQVPVQVLLGVYGAETNFGRDSNTSSTGAMGGFQFEPATAASYSYPLTNSPDAAQFQQQADAAAAYLSSLFKSHGSWDAAVSAYSGGGYGLSHVNSEFTQTPSNFAHEVLQAIANLPTGSSAPPGLTGPGGVAGALDTGATAVGTAASDVASSATVLSSIWGAISDPSNWLRGLKILAGVIAIFFAMKSLVGASSPTVKLAGVKAAS